MHVHAQTDTYAQTDTRTETYVYLCTYIFSAGDLNLYAKRTHARTRYIHVHIHYVMQSDDSTLNCCFIYTGTFWQGKASTDASISIIFPASL